MSSLHNIVRLTAYMLLASMSIIHLAGCSFTPVYQKGGASIILEDIDVITRDNREGQLLKAALEDLLSPDKRVNAAQARYTLNAGIQIDTMALSIEADGTTRRFRLIGSSPITLKDNEADKILLQDKVERLSSYNISDEDYSTYVAGRDSKQQVIDAVAESIRLRLINYFANDALIAP